jgi:hypothetical protein
MALRMTDYSAFPRIEGLVDLACRNGVDVRPTLLRVLTDLYVQAPRHTPDEEAQYVELALRLIDSVDAPTRDIVAAHLGTYPRAPRQIVHRLAELGAAVAPPLAPELPAQAVAELGTAFFAADSYERQMMLTNLEAADLPHRVPAAVETCKRLEAAALSNNTAEFVQILESALLLPRTIAEQVVADTAGEPLVVAAKALGMERASLQRILLVLNPAIGHSVERVYALSALHDEISVATADSMVGIWRGRAPQQQRRTTYQPGLYDDQQRSARSAATPSRYQSTARRSDPLAARLRNLGR